MMINILSIILLVFGVLQIILFFKLWGMTNDVRSIKDQFAANNKELEYYIKSMNEHLRKMEGRLLNDGDKDK